MAVARDRLLIATDLSHERERNRSQKEPLSDDDNEGPPRKASKQNPSTRFRGGFKSHHMLTFPSTANKKYPHRACRECLIDKKKKTPDTTAKSVVFLSVVYLVLENTIRKTKLNKSDFIYYLLVLPTSHKCSECKEKIE